MSTSRHLGVLVAAPAREVCAHAADPARLPAWAAGPARSGVEHTGDHRVVEPPAGRVLVDLTPPNDPGVLDHSVTPPGGEQVLDPLRVVPDGQGCEVVFTVRRRPGTSEADFERGCAAVLVDLETLRSLLEHR